VFGPDIEDMELTIRDLGKRLLWLRWKFSTDERMLRIAGEDGAWDLEAFRGQMLKNGGENDQVQAGSGLPQSKAAKQAAIQQVRTATATGRRRPPPRRHRRERLRDRRCHLAPRAAHQAPRTVQLRRLKHYPPLRKDSQPQVEP
jgi:hypothetical protein